MSEPSWEAVRQQLTDFPPTILTDTPENEGIKRFFAL